MSLIPPTPSRPDSVCESARGERWQRPKIGHDLIEANQSWGAASSWKGGGIDRGEPGLDLVGADDEIEVVLIQKLVQRLGPEHRQPA